MHPSRPTAPTSPPRRSPTTYCTELAQWRANYPSLPSPVTNRTALHRLQRLVVAAEDASSPTGCGWTRNYYYWPGSWVQNRPGFMTGSGMPMRFADTDGVDDRHLPGSHPDDRRVGPDVSRSRPNTLLDNALGPLGYYGAFNANMHTDAATIAAERRADRLGAGSRRADRQREGRCSPGSTGATRPRTATSPGAPTRWASRCRSGAGATGLTGMLPTAGPNGTQLTGITRAGVTVSTTDDHGQGHRVRHPSPRPPAATPRRTPPRRWRPRSRLRRRRRCAHGHPVGDVDLATDAVSTSEVSVGTAATSLTNKVMLGTRPASTWSRSTGSSPA